MSKCVCVCDEFNWKRFPLADAPNAIPTTELLLLTIATECVCAFALTSFPHITALCLPVSLYSIPYPPFIPLSQPKLQCVSPVSSFSVHSFKVRFYFFFLPFSLSLAPSLWATPRPFAWVLIWYERRENLSLWIYVSDDTSDISLEWSRVTSFLQKKITIFKINPWLPPIFPFFFSCALYQMYQERRLELPSITISPVVLFFDKKRGYQDLKEKWLAVNPNDLGSSSRLLA